jgi:hypothetical protein
MGCNAVSQNKRSTKPTPYLPEDLLLLMISVLISIIVIALARPAIKSSATGILGVKTTSIIVLDNSYSMSASDGTLDWFTRRGMWLMK